MAARRRGSAAALPRLGLLAALLAPLAPTFAALGRAARQQPAAQPRRLVQRQAAAEPATAAVAEVSSEDAAAAAEIYESWAEQFPIAAAREDFYNLGCSKADVEDRFLHLAGSLKISGKEAKEIFEPDLWPLCITKEKLTERLTAMREVADSEAQLLELLRFAPRILGTTTAEEIRGRGVDNMRARAALGAGYEALTAPIRMFFKLLAKRTAGQIRDAEGGDGEAIGEQERKNAGYVFLALNAAFISYCLYADIAFGGPIHGKGLCAASFVPTYNIPDAEGQSRLPCNCAPIWKWYLEPKIAPEDRLRWQPKVESKNCGNMIGSKKKECDPTTAGGCVWTAEDLERDPSTWDNRGGKLYWELRREN